MYKESTLLFCLIYLGKSDKIEVVSSYTTVKICKTTHKRNILKERRKVDYFTKLTFVEGINLTP